MKLRNKEFESYAERNGMNPNAMLRELGGGKDAYKRLKKGCSLGYDLAREIYNALGERNFISLVDFEEETINGFKAKYSVIGNQLY